MDDADLKALLRSVEAPAADERFVRAVMTRASRRGMARLPALPVAVAVAAVVAAGAAADGGAALSALAQASVAAGVLSLMTLQLLRRLPAPRRVG